LVLWLTASVSIKLICVWFNEVIVLSVFPVFSSSLSQPILEVWKACNNRADGFDKICNTSTSGLGTWDSNPDKGMEMFFFTTLPRIPLAPNLTPMKKTPESTFWLYHKADPCPLFDFWCRGNLFYFLL